MNHKVLALTKVFLKNSFQRNVKVVSTQKSNRKIGMILLYILAFGYIAGIFGYFSYIMISSLQTIEQEALFLGIYFLAIACLVLFQSVFSSLNVFYFSKDLETVLPLPLKPREILMAKFNVVLVTEYITELLFGAIPIVLYGILTGGGLQYYLLATMFLIIFPILPLLISSFCVMFLMSFAKLTKSREKFQFFVTILIIIFVIGIQFIMPAEQQLSQEDVNNLLLQANSLVDSISGYFITLGPTVNGLTSNDFLISLYEWAKVAFITLLAYVVYIFSAQKLYFRGAIGNLVGGNVNRRKDKTKNKYNKQRLAISYIAKEIKILIRNPIFCMQCILPALLMPAIILVSIYTSVTYEVGTEQIQEVLKSQNIDFYTMEILLLILGTIQFFTMFIFIAATAVSRDGKNANFIKYIPVSLHKQFIYKAMPNVIVSIIPVIMVLGVVYIITNVSIIFLSIIGILAIMINVIQSYALELVDLRKPKLEWDTEYAVVKQNINLMWPFVYSFITIGILIILAIILNNINIFIGIPILALIIGIVYYLVNKYIKNNQQKLFEKIM